MRIHSPRWVLILSGLALFLGAPSRAQEIPTPTCCKGIIYVADGAGDFHVPSSTLQSVVREAGLPMTVERVAWSHGTLRSVRDLVHHHRHLDAGAQLAACVQTYRKEHPGERIVLVGHSAGAAVVLAAAECLPEGSVDRIILLGAAVSAGYDLHLALRCAREGIDSFYSPRDGVLSTFVVAFGTADRKLQLSGGWFGFRPIDDEELMSKLRQHSWGLSMMKSLNFGGHFGSCSVAHLRAQVLPLLCTSTVQSVQAASPAVTQVCLSSGPRVRIVDRLLPNRRGLFRN